MKNQYFENITIDPVYTSAKCLWNKESIKPFNNYFGLGHFLISETFLQL